MIMGLKPDFVIKNFQNHIQQSKRLAEPHRSIALKEVADTLGQMVVIAIQEGVIAKPK